MATVAETQQNTQAALAAAVQSLKLPTQVMGQAAQLLSRLQSKTRVTLMGLPKSGKSGVFNLLAGADILPDGFDATVQLVHGDAPQAEVTLPDGTALKLDGAPDLENIGAMAPVFVKLHMDLPSLKKISLLEVAPGSDRAEQQRAVAWAVKQTDIGIWCTDGFTAAEQALWSHVPDTLKDHAILLRTRADTLGDQRATALDDLRNALEDDFAFFLAISMLEANAAKADGSLDKAAFKASGATGLISTILRQIERGRQTAVDQADILLLKHANAAEAEKTAPEPAADVEADEPEVSASTASDVAPVEESVEAVEEDISPVAEPIDVEAEAPAQDVAAEPTLAPVQTADEFAFSSVQASFAATAAAPETAQPVEVSTETEGKAAKKVLETALERLTDTGEAIATFDAADTRKILRATGKTLDWLNDHFADADETPVFSSVREQAQDASDLVQLLKAEGGDEGSEDAVIALLQIKRGIQAELAQN
jgi:hypothetical protein